MLTIVTVKENPDDFFSIMLRRFADQLSRTITAPIVNKDELKRKVRATAGIEAAPDEFRQVLFFIEDRNDDRDHEVITPSIKMLTTRAQ
jgi:hypothetical protein